MQKICPRCKSSFDCRNDNILECWCLEEVISPEVRAFLSSHYQGCLCRSCIQLLSNEYFNHLNTLQNEKM